MGNRPLTERIKEHHKLVAEVARLQAEVDRDRPAALAALPAAYGYRNMDSFIKAVTQACGQPQRRKKVARAPRANVSVKPKSADVEIGIGMAKATEAAPAPAEPPRPSGTSLDDPKNFGLLPDRRLLETTAGDSRIQQAKLADDLKFAQKVLHTSGVPAAIWREWRQFEQKASDVLRSLNTVVHSNPTGQDSGLRPPADLPGADYTTTRARRLGPASLSPAVRLSRATSGDHAPASGLASLGPPETPRGSGQ